MRVCKRNYSRLIHPQYRILAFFVKRRVSVITECGSFWYKRPVGYAVFDDYEQVGFFMK